MADHGLTAGAVARRLGVAVTTLRTWHQRYNLGPSDHQPGKHRRYTDEDLARLEVMQRLVADGVPPGQAARWVRERPMSVTAALRPGSPAPAMTPTAPTVARRDGGGLPVGSSPAARGLARAAVRLDAESIRRIVAAGVSHLGVVGAWDTVVRPVLAAIGDRHSRTGRMVEVEHVLSGCVSQVLAAVPRPNGNGARVLLACADEEQHSLPIEALAAALAQSGVVCRVLGARVPPAALHAAVQRIGPAAVLVWSHHPGTACIEQLVGLGSDRPFLLAVAGPGWLATTLPDGVAVPKSLGEAVELLRSAVR